MKPRDPTGKRQSILDLVAQRPGVHKSLLCRILGLSWGTASHHIRHLHKKSRLAIVKSGREVRLYPPGTPPRHLLWLAHLHNDVDAAIMRQLAMVPDLRARELSLSVGRSAHIIRRHLTTLVDEGLVVPAGAYNRRFRLDGRADGGRQAGDSLAEEAQEAARQAVADEGCP